MPTTLSSTPVVRLKTSTWFDRVYHVASVTYSSVVCIASVAVEYQEADRLHLVWIECELEKNWSVETVLFRQALKRFSRQLSCSRRTIQLGANSMKQHVAKVVATCFYLLRRLRQIRRRVGAEVTTQLVLAFITSRLDYCNSVLAGVPQSIFEPLTSSKRCINADSPSEKGGTCAAATVVRYALAHSVQTMHDDALDTHGKMLSLPEQHGRDNRQPWVHCVPPSGHHNLIFTSPHGCTPYSLVSERSRMLDLQHGTHYQPTFVPNVVKLISRNCSKLTYSVVRILVDFCVYCSSHIIV